MSWRDALDALGYESRVSDEPQQNKIRPIVAPPGMYRTRGAPSPGVSGVAPGRGMQPSPTNASLSNAYLQKSGIGSNAIGAWDPSKGSLAEGPYGRGWKTGLQAIWDEQLAESLGEWEAQAKADEAEQKANETPNAGQPSAPTKGGGGWDFLDTFDNDYAKSSNTHGVPANVIKAIQRVETGGADYNGDENCDIRPGDCVALNSGIFKSTAESYGMDYNKILNDQGYAIQGIGRTLAAIAASDTSDWGGPGGNVLETGGWELVAKIYHGGPNVYKPGWKDENGVGSDEYAGHVANYINQLEAKGASPGTNGQSISSPTNPASGQVGNYNGKAIADLADSYANSGIDYDWGGAPLAGDDPANYTSKWDGTQKRGWDCSGFVSFIFDTLGYAEWDQKGGLPNGSHYQAQWAIDNQRWGEGYDLSQLQPGDLVFLDTGPGADGGGGQNEVSSTASRATHVGIYLGDGKMINAMNPCEAGETMGVNCGTGVVSIADPNSGWGALVIGWADTSDIVGGAARDVQPSNGTSPGASSAAPVPAPTPTTSTAPVSTPAPGGTLPREETGWSSSAGNVR